MKWKLLWNQTLGSDIDSKVSVLLNIANFVWANLKLLPYLFAIFSRISFIYSLEMRIFFFFPLSLLPPFGSLVLESEDALDEGCGARHEQGREFTAWSIQCLGEAKLEVQDAPMASWHRSLSTYLNHRVPPILSSVMKAGINQLDSTGRTALHLSTMNGYLGPAHCHVWDLRR